MRTRASTNVGPPSRFQLRVIRPRPTCPGGSTGSRRTHFPFVARASRRSCIHPCVKRRVAVAPPRMAMEFMTSTTSGRRCKWVPSRPGSDPESSFNARWRSPTPAASMSMSMSSCTSSSGASMASIDTWAPAETRRTAASRDRAASAALRRAAPTIRCPCPRTISRSATSWSTSTASRPGTRLVECSPSETG